LLQIDPKVLEQKLSTQDVTVRDNPGEVNWRSESATSGKAGGLKKVEPLKADRSCEPLKAVRL
jgi:hypothetical protein